MWLRVRNKETNAIYARAVRLNDGEGPLVKNVEVNKLIVGADNPQPNQ